MTLPWWKYGSIVEQQNTATTSKAISWIDKMANQRLGWIREREALGRDIAQARFERLKNSIQSWRNEKAVAEINAANQQLLEWGQQPIPITDTTISNQLTSGRTWVDQYLQATQVAMEEDRMANAQREAEEWAKWQTKQAGANWADYSPLRKQEIINEWTQRVLTGDLPGTNVAEVEGTQTLQPWTLGFAKAKIQGEVAGVGARLAEEFGDEEEAARLRTIQQQWQDKYRIPIEKGEEIQEGIYLMPDYSVVSNNQTVGKIDPTTGEFIEKEPAWWEKANQILKWVPPNIASNLIEEYGFAATEKVDLPFMIQEQARVLQNKQESGFNLTETEQQFMEQYKSEVGEPPDFNELLATLHPVAPFALTWKGADLSPSEELKKAYYDSAGIGTQILQGLTTPLSIALLTTGGLGGATATQSRLAQVASKGGVTGKMAQAGRIVTAPLVGYEWVAGQLISKTVGATYRTVMTAVLKRQLASWAASVGIEIPKETADEFLKWCLRNLKPSFLGKEAVRTFFKPVKGGFTVTQAGAEAAELAASNAIRTAPMLAGLAKTTTSVTSTPPVTGVAPAMGAVTKEPWQMTQSEVIELAKTEAATRKYVDVQGYIDNALIWHKVGIGNALSEGKPVPQEVLKDYPDLTKKAPSRVRYEKGSVGDAVRAAKKLKSDVDLYVYPTGEGMAIDKKPPPFGIQHIIIRPDGTHRVVSADTSWHEGREAGVEPVASAKVVTGETPTPSEGTVSISEMPQIKNLPEERLLTGEGLTVYRGQRPLKKGQVYASDAGDLGRGIYYSTSRSVAKAHAGEENVTETKLQLKNPLVVSEHDAYDILTRQYNTINAEMDVRLAEAERLTRDMLAQGYDGLVSVRTEKSGKILEIVDYRPYATPSEGTVSGETQALSTGETITGEWGEGVSGETQALSTGETITGEWGEGVIEVTGLESKEYDALRQLRTLRTRYANQKIKYEEAKSSLIDYVKANVPKEVQGKMLTAVKNVKTELGLQRAMARADAVAEQATQKALRTKITNELRKIKPTKTQRYGKFTAETQRQLNAIKANTGMDREVARSQILKNIEAAENGKMPFEEADRANEILQVSGLKGMSSDELANTLQEIKSLKETGRGLRAVEKQAEAESIEKFRADVISTITGGKGIKPGVGTVDTRDMWAREGKVKSFITNWQYGLDDVLDKISRLDKSSKPFQSPVSQLGFNLHASRSIQQSGVIDWVDTKTANKIKEIYGVKGRRELDRWLGDSIQRKIDLGTFANTEGQKVTLSLTKGQIMQKYLELQDPTLEETFRVGMKWTDEMINVTKDSLTAEDLEYVNWLAKQYAIDYVKTIKPVYEGKYHIPMPENPNYVPIGRDLEGTQYEHILMAQDNFRYASVANQSLKARTKNVIPLRFNDATQVWVRHVIQMEHFKAFAQSMKQARMVFGNKDVQTAIKQYHGNDILKHLERHLDDIARDGIDRALIVQGVDKLRGHFTLAALGVKANVAMKQALSLPAYLTYEPMPIKDFFTGVADFWKHPMANIREMKSLSGYFSERWGRGHERDVRLVKEKDVAGRLSNSKNWRDLLMLGIHKVDTAVTQPGAWAVYKSMLKQGMSKQEAITHAEVATKRSQPSFGLEDMAALRKHGSWGKLFTMFQSQPNKYYRLIANSTRNLLAGRGSMGRNIFNILSAWWILPSLFQFVSDAFQWKKEHQLRVAILGPANYLLAAGQMLQSVYGWITDEPFPAEASPVFSTLRELQYAITGVVNMLEDGRDPAKDIDTDYLVNNLEHWAKAIGQVAGLPTPYAVQIERMIRNADLRQLVFSEYALESEADAVKLLQDTYADAMYGKKWKDLTPDQQNEFYELRPDLK